MHLFSGLFADQEEMLADDDNDDIQNLERNFVKNGGALRLERATSCMHVT